MSIFEQPYQLTAQSIEEFQRNGHVCLDGVLPADSIQQVHELIVDSANKYGQRDVKPMDERDTYGKAFLQHMNLWEFDDRIRDFVLSPRFGEIAARLLGVKGIRIYHDQALFKEAGGGHTPWHQDQYYWPVDTDNTITMWMPLVDIDQNMGMLTFASGSHRQGLLNNLPISDQSEVIFKNYVTDQGFEISRQQTMNAGDATFHRGTTLHCAPGNRSKQDRDVMTIIYIAEDTRTIEPRNENQQADLARWFPGLQPNEPAASPINPVVWASRPSTHRERIDHE